MRFLVLILALVSLTLTASCKSASAGIDGPPPRMKSHYGDKRLYRDIAARVAAGQSYYEAAPALHRAHHYPLKPVFTVRPPSLVWLAAAIGWERLRVAAYGLWVVAGLAWFQAVRKRTSLPEGMAAAILCTAAGWALLGGNPVILHERWAGLFLTLALALRLDGRIGWSLAAAACALAIRELALPFVLLALAFSLAERRRSEALAWTVLLAGYGALLAWHWHLVGLHTLPGDLASQGWGGGFRPLGAIRAIVYTSPLQWAPVWLAIGSTLAAALGWFALGRRDGLFCFALFAGLALMIALFARPDNFYWGALVQPGWFVGLALLPRCLAAALRRARRRRQSVTLARSDPDL